MEDTLKGKYLIFGVEKEEYAIEIQYVTEIIGIQPITEVPELPDYIRGIINLRGKIIPVMDIRVRFGKEFRNYDDRTCIIVIEIGTIFIGIIVDRISEVVDIKEEDISPSPQITQGFNHKYVMGIGRVDNKVKLILACDRLLKDELKENLKMNEMEE